MESSYTFLTLKEGEFNLTYQSNDQFVDKIEELTGIYIPDQNYYSEGQVQTLSSILNNESKCFQLTSKENKHSRLFINTPQGTLKLYLKNLETTKVEDLIQSFKSECKKKSFDYPCNRYAFSFNNEIIQPGQSLSHIFNDNIIDLVEQEIYEDIKDFNITVKTQTGKSINFEIDLSQPVKYLKNLIRVQTGVPSEQQRLMFKGKLLEDDSDLSTYELCPDSIIYLVLRLRGGGGGAPSSFGFNSMNQPVNIEFSQSAPDWRAVSPGISWFGDCYNSECVAFNKEVVSNHGFGVFDVRNERNKAKCMMCEQSIGMVDVCGFFDCKFRYFGVLENGEVREGSGHAGVDDYTAFLNGERVEWRVLRIQVEP